MDIEDLNIEVEPVEEVSVETSDNEEINVEVGGEVIVTGNYKELSNKPQINNIELVDNLTLDQLGIQEEGNYPDTRVTNLEIDNLF